MTKLRPGDRVRVIAPHSDHHHKTGTVECVTDYEGRKPTATIKLDTGGKIFAGPNALVLVAS